MADPQALEALRVGGDTWITYRQQHQDLRGVDLFGVDLFGVDLIRVDLTKPGSTGLVGVGEGSYTQKVP